jgi:hypothetical protein
MQRQEEKQEENSQRASERCWKFVHTLSKIHNYYFLSFLDNIHKKGVALSLNAPAMHT